MQELQPLAALAKLAAAKLVLDVITDVRGGQPSEPVLPQLFKAWRGLERLTLFDLRGSVQGAQARHLICRPLR